MHEPEGGLCCMGLKEQVQAAAETALTATPDGLTGEALTGMVAKQVKRQLPMGQVVSALRERPQRFVEDEGGRWRLRTQEVLLLPDDVPDTLSSNDTASAASSATRNLTRGCYVIFDLEATHQDATSSATEIIQIAAQRFEHGVLCSTWDSFAQPLVPIPEHIIQLTHISNEDVANALPLAEVLREFFERFGDLPLIAHNGASYDGPLLRATCERLNLPLPSTFLVLDTLPLARLLLPCEASHTVSTLAQRYGCLREDAHRADADVEMLAGVVRGLEAEFQCGADGAAAYDLLRRA
ncbi:MAG TPA: hypothetical protein DHW02_14050, partial [Ktedonobacter sp.]|nr:hypothetical protein [Ktedonobacter sp.]